MTASKIQYNPQSLDNIAVKLSDVPLDIAYRAFKDFLFGSKIYADRARLDFWAILEPETDQMFITKSDGVPKNIALSHTSVKWWKGHTSTKTFEMSPDFLDRLQNPGAKELFIERALIKDVLDNHLADDHAAVLKWYLFPTIKLSSYGEGTLARFQGKLDRMKDDTRRNQRTSAIKALIQSIILIQDGVI